MINIDADLDELGAAVEEDKRIAAEEAFGADSKKQDQENGMLRWFKRLPQNVGTGLLDAAINMYDSQDMLNPAGAGTAAAKNINKESQKANLTPHQRRMGGAEALEADPVREAALGFRNWVAGKNNTTSDTVTQSISQFMIPFLGWSKALNVTKAATTAARVGGAVAAESATMATAFDPHGGRLADLVVLGKETEGKFADLLNVVAPDGSAFNAYIDYMAEHENESEAEGRFKNVVDGLVGSAAVAGVIKAGATTFRGARAFAESPIKLPEIGAPTHLAEGSAMELPDAISKEAEALAETTLKQFDGDPRLALVNLTEQADNTLDDVEREAILAARDRVASGAPEQGVSVVPSPEGHTVVVGKQPLMTFLNEEDAAAAVADAQKMLGTNFQTRAAAEHATASDSNFATLHSFSRVLKTNIDRPVSTHSLLSALERNLKGDTEQGAFYKELLQRLVRKKVAGTTTVSSKAGRHENSAGYFAHALNGIDLYEKAFRDTKTLLHTFTHEAVHAATVHEMNASARVLSQMERLRKTTLSLFEEQADAAEKATGGRAGRPYGFTNGAEFVAEIESNPEFRKLMQKTKLPEGGTAWDKYLETIAGIFGITALIATPQGRKEFSKLMMGNTEQEKPSA